MPCAARRNCSCSARYLRLIRGSSRLQNTGISRLLNIGISRYLEQVKLRNAGAPRHCERSEAIQSHKERLDCVVASLLAMTTNHSRVAAIFAEQIELLLHRTIREAEQHRILAGLVGDPAPARHDEQIARAPFESLVADPASAMALDRGEHGGVGRTIARGLETFRQQLDEGADGRHREIPGLGIGEFQLQTVAGVPLAALPGLLQRLAGVAVGIVEDRRRLRGALLVDRQQIVTVASKLSPGGFVIFCWSSFDPSAKD